MKKILVVEDDLAIAKGLEQLLLLESYSVILSQNGFDGFNLALKDKPDLVLLDLNLPKLNGLDVCRKLRENNFDNPILILTSKSESIDKIIGLEVGADDYITKPFNNREIISRVRAHLRLADRIKKSAADKTGDTNENGIRKLLAVFFSDMKDYSKKMHEEEQLALKLLGIHNELIKSELDKTGGRIVEIIGDAFLAAFNSCVHAVDSAVNIQRAFLEYNEEKSDDEKIEIRIGIHIGEVIDYGNHLKGDTINIASRIQEAAPANSILVSDSVYRTVYNKIKYNFKFVEEKQFKNIKSKIPIYEVLFLQND